MESTLVFAVFVIVWHIEVPQQYYGVMKIITIYFLYVLLLNFFCFIISYCFPFYLFISPS